MGDLLDQLRAYARSGLYPMHTPGHKRNAAFAQPDLPFALDLTEVEGLDELYCANGILAAAMADAAALYGSDEALYLVGGSTVGVLSGLLAAAPPGSSVVMARNSHRSAYGGLELGGHSPVYLYPELDEPFGVAGSISPEAVARALSAHPEARLVFVTSPTYDGVVSDVAAIAAVAHARGVPLMVDSAHGAHLGFSPAFPAGAVATGADLTVMSLHKTLPALTPAALLHVRGGRVDRGEVWRRLSTVQTSSPPYPLMASIGRCVSVMADRGAELMAAHAARLDRFSDQVRALARLRVLRMGRDWGEPHPAIFDFDRCKILISTRGTDLTGPALARALRDRYRIETEMAAPDYALALTGPCDADEGLDRLAAALLMLDREARGGEISRGPAPGDAPVRLGPAVQALPLTRAASAPWTDLPVGRAVGRVAREYVWLYPPGVPLIAPGETVGEELAAAAQSLWARGLPLRRSSGGPAGFLRVVADA